MTKLNELRQALGVATDEHKRLADELPALIDDGQAFEAKKVEVTAAKAKVDRCRTAVQETEDALQRSALMAGPALEDQRRSLVQHRRPLYSGLKAFKDFKDDRGTLVRADEQAYRVGQFVLATVFGIEGSQKWCKDNGIILTKAQSEGVNSAGGWLVPEEMMAAIIDLRETFGVFRRSAQVVPMGRDTLNWPRRTGGVTAYFVSEGVAPTESSATWDNVNLTAKKLAALIRLSTELSEDAIINVADWIVNEISYAFASKEDDCGFLGDGTSTYGGITGLANKFTGLAGLFTATGHATFDAVTATDISSTMALLPQYALPGAKFYCSQYAFALMFERLIAAAGGNSIATLNGEVQYRYLGTPIVISQKLPSTTPTGLIGLYYGDLSKAAAMGERRQVSVKRSDDRYFDTDQIGLMGTERVDINVHDVGSSTVAGPIVAMKMG
jgi:HK97 family phage major capsid protein